MKKILRLFLGSANDRALKTFNASVKKINQYQESFKALTDEELQGKTAFLKEKVESGVHLSELLPEAFATVREAAWRVLGMRPYDVQLIGGMTLHEGMIAEMKTGEGKTLMATLPVYLNTLTGKGVHIVTVNDYLVKRDAKTMGKLYNFLGLSVGCIYHGLSDYQRREAYGCDVTYGTNSEFGFDYLKDNMKFKKEDMVMRPFNFAIVDEVDSILIDEARTPLIISGPAEDSSELYKAINVLIPHLIESDYEKDEKQHTVILSEAGIEKMESLLREHDLLKGGSLYDVNNIALVHHVHAALKAHKLFSRDVDYIVKDQQVIIIDEFTGRMMEGRRYSDGLHQALEAKEKVHIQTENQTLASITYQNFFRQYPKLSGMAGTAMTEEAEFEEIYKLRVIEIPPNVPVQRRDLDDHIYLTTQGKYTAVVALIKECRERGQPVLVGTTSIEKSELISNLLNKEQIPHQVLNARHHEKEAYIIAEAGRFGAVTVATNMAGRGTDIQLGGNLDMRLEKELEGIDDPNEIERITQRVKDDIFDNKEKVKAAGGLFIIGTERHESRRVDNQLRGRAGRQGDPGASQFFISIQDELIRVFGATQRMDTMLRRFGTKEDEVLAHKWLNRSIEKAQQRIEAHNFDIRKNLLRFDDVMNDQRKVVYNQRLEIMDSTNLSDLRQELFNDVVDQFVDKFENAKASEGEWDFDQIYQDGKRLFSLDFPVDDWKSQPHLTPVLLRLETKKLVDNFVENVSKTFDSITSEKNMLLRVLDHSWKNHLLTLDHLRQGINLRSYAQGNPLNEYKKEAFHLFQSMMEQVKTDFASAFCHYEGQHISSDDDEEEDDESQQLDFLKNLDMDKLMKDPNFLKMLSDDLRSSKNFKDLIPEKEDQTPIEEIITPPKTRNSLCPCGSRKRYKNCHGQVDTI
jgi:preprotein translocase subunit SecA